MSKGLNHFGELLKEIDDHGLTKGERILQTRQGTGITVGRGDLLNFCANNYLGLSGRPELAEAAKAGFNVPEGHHPIVPIMVGDRYG